MKFNAFSKNLLPDVLVSLPAGFEQVGLGDLLEKDDIASVGSSRDLKSLIEQIQLDFQNEGKQRQGFNNSSLWLDSFNHKLSDALKLSDNSTELKLENEHSSLNPQTAKDWIEKVTGGFDDTADRLLINSKGDKKSQHSKLQNNDVENIQASEVNSPSTSASDNVQNKANATQKPDKPNKINPGDFKDLKSVPAANVGRGLTAEYFNGEDFDILALERIDSQIDFNWRTGSPDAAVDNNKFSVRWSGMVEPEHSETYKFSTISDDGVRLWVNGELLIDSWRNQSRKERSGEITLEAGLLYDIKLEYFEKGGLAVSQLSWESESQAKEVIPASAFYQKVDLQPQYFNVIQEPLEFGDSFEVEFQVKNVEVGITADFDVDFYLSKEGTDFYLGSQRIDSLKGNSESLLETIELTLPDRDSAFWTGDGNYLLRMIVDGKEEVREINELNNSEQGLFVDSDEVQITDPYKVDLVAGAFDVVQEPLAYGDSFEIQFAVDNTQKTDIGAFDVNFYISRDNQISSDDFLLGTYSVGSLSGFGTTGLLSASFSLPDDADAFAGQDLFLFGMTIDEANIIEEINDDNNANRGEFFDSDIVQISATGQSSGVNLADELGRAGSGQYEFEREVQPLIGIIDTGFAYNNPDLDYSRFIVAKDYVDGDTSSLLGTGEGNEHGSHILGIIGATQNNGIGIDGLNDDAPVWLSRAIGSGQWATALTDFVNAAIASGQPNAVVNLSLDLTQINADGSETTRYELTPEERQALEYARQNDVLIVTAAGNDGNVMSVLGQASKEFDNIITVGAANGLARAGYSSYGDGLDLLAEGSAVSTIGDDLGTMSGTSVAAAQVTGAASLVWAANSNLNYQQVKEILTSTANDLNTPGWDEETGAGLLNLDEAVELAQSTTGVDYDPEALILPTTWSGEGSAIPMERAVASYFPTNGKYYDWQTYYVQPGDTLSQIALDTLGGYTPEYYNWIANYNNIPDPDLIYTYTTIFIPVEVAPPTTGGGGGTTPPFYEDIPQQYPWLGNPVGGTINQGNGFLKQEFENGYIIDNGSEIVVYQYGNGSAEGGLHSNPSSGNPLWGFLDPLKGAGSLSRDRHGSDASSRSYFAKDYGAPIGTPIYSMRSGTVTRVVESYADYPSYVDGGPDAINRVNYVVVELDDLDGFDDDYQAVYAHVQQNSVIVNVGDRVEAGQLIARTGHNGWSTGPHLHLEVNKRSGTSPWGYTKPFNIDNIGGGSTGIPVATISGDSLAYTIVSGDTLSAIALRFLGDASRWREITDANGNTFTEEQARYLQIGQVVYLPGSGGSSQAPGGSNDLTSYTIQSGDRLWDLAEQYLGSGSRWREITKPDGSSFTEAEARNLQPGQIVYFPGGSNPTNPQPPSNPTDPQPPTNPNPPEPSVVVEIYSVTDSKDGDFRAFRDSSLIVSGYSNTSDMTFYLGNTQLVSGELNYLTDGVFSARLDIPDNISLGRHELKIQVGNQKFSHGSYNEIVEYDWDRHYLGTTNGGDDRHIIFERVNSPGYIQNIPTWLVIHGWDGKAGGFKDLGQAIEEYDGITSGGNYQVLTLDWDAARTGKAALYAASTWINKVAELTKNVINSWGISANNINLVGHSLGAYVSYEISERMSGIDKLVALHPATTTAGGYDLNQVNFRQYSNWSWAFWHNNATDSGDNTLTADEAFSLDLPFANVAEGHGAMKTLWENMLRDKNGKVSQYFGLEDMNGNGKPWYIGSGWEAEIKAKDVADGWPEVDWVPTKVYEI